jgi:hypothetical protein
MRGQRLGPDPKIKRPIRAEGGTRMKYVFSNFGKKSEWMDDITNEEQAYTFEIEELMELPAKEGWYDGIDGLMPPEGWYGFELINEPGRYYITTDVRNVIMKFAYIASEGYAPSWISRPPEATNKTMRRVMKIFYY